MGGEASLATLVLLCYRFIDRGSIASYSTGCNEQPMAPTMESSKLGDAHSAASLPSLQIS